MRIDYRPTPEEVRAKRKKAYTKAYPIEVQMEALTEAALGRTEKLEALKQGLSEIRESLPFAEEVR
ncbi:hypothetical protein L2W58_12550 [Dethiosulfovibrio sp. F2B]|uniref:hypothetical protein n=1 Tax=Dethiosulfovibrio faecalis TaxID=2720018 RepID=UPI001F2FAD0B|nr:hypothetical protein [Dethiosulfovibrio faecalis]MCF4152627.1 hypothetical protein [Dethiosulfovibrio faecalis]